MATDRAALVALYNATGGANWTNNTNWTSNEALSGWHGVIHGCERASHETCISLREWIERGDPGAELGDLTSLLNLLSQRRIHLSGEIPAELGGLTSLQHPVSRGQYT